MRCLAAVMAIGLTIIAAMAALPVHRR